MKINLLLKLATFSGLLAKTIIDVSSVDEALSYFAQEKRATEYLYRIQAIGINESIVSEFQLANDSDKSSSFKKRWNAKNAPLGTYFTEWRVADQGIWVQEWQPASGCQYTGHSSEPLRYQKGWSQSTNWKVDAGFLFDIARTFAAKMGAEVLKHYGKNENWEISIPPDLVGQIWTQKRMVWQDQQKRKCIRKHYGKTGLKCLDWSDKIHGDLPDSTPYNTGISTGHDKVRC